MDPKKVYVLYKLLAGTAINFTSTTYIPRLLKHGLSLGDILFINIFFWGTIVLMELPTGMLADGKSRGWSVRTGILISSLGALMYSFATTIPSAITCEILIGTGFAFISGADSAWIADALKNRGEYEQLQRVNGTATLLHALGAVVGGATGALVGMIHLDIPWIVSGSLYLCNFFFLWKFMLNDGEPNVRITEFAAFKESFKALKNSQHLIWSVGALGIYSLVIAYNFYWTPFFEGRAGQIALGFIWIITYGSLAIAGFIVRTRTTLNNHARTNNITICAGIAGLALAITGHFPGILIPLITVTIHEIARGAFMPLHLTYTHNHIESSYRATFISLQSLLGKVGTVITLSMLWWYSHAFPKTEASIVRIWTLSGIILSLAAVILWFLRPKNHSATTAS